MKKFYIFNEKINVENGKMSLKMFNDILIDEERKGRIMIEKIMIENKVCEMCKLRSFYLNEEDVEDGLVDIELLIIFDVDNFPEVENAVERFKDRFMKAYFKIMREVFMQDDEFIYERVNVESFYNFMENVDVERSIYENEEEEEEGSENLMLNFWSEMEKANFLLEKITSYTWYYEFIPEELLIIKKKKALDYINKIKAEHILKREGNNLCRYDLFITIFSDQLIRNNKNSFGKINKYICHPNISNLYDAMDEINNAMELERLIMEKVPAECVSFSNAGDGDQIKIRLCVNAIDDIDACNFYLDYKQDVIDIISKYFGVFVDGYFYRKHRGLKGSCYRIKDKINEIDKYYELCCYEAFGHRLNYKYLENIDKMEILNEVVDLDEIRCRIYGEKYKDVLELEMEYRDEINKCGKLFEMNEYFKYLMYRIREEKNKEKVNNIYKFMEKVISEKI